MKPVVAGLVFVGLLLSGASTGTLRAQGAAAAQTNPEGLKGALKPRVETGGGYDAHSGNISRSVTDLKVPNAFGVYGLDFTRHWNSLEVDYTNAEAVQSKDFGDSGWYHSWAWSPIYKEELIQVEDTGGVRPTYVTSITITFPDGHATKYKLTRFQGQGGRLGPPFVATEVDWPTAGESVHDRLGGMATDGSAFWLYLADGGAVHFLRSTPGQNAAYYASEIFDPNGFRTRLTYTLDGLTRVEQDGGRFLTIHWNGGVIDYVETGGAALSQRVEYHYTAFGIYQTLTSVVYPEAPPAGETGPVKATYRYNNCYGAEPEGGGLCQEAGVFPLLKEADDPHFDGAMTKILYDYRGVGCYPPYQPPPAPPPGYYMRMYAEPTAIAAEREPVTRLAVSSFFIDCNGGVRQETNGFGARRWLNFGLAVPQRGNADFGNRGHQLGILSEFTLQYTLASVPFDQQNFKDGQPRQVWDGRGNMTENVIGLGGDTGEPGEIHYPDGGARFYDRVNPIMLEPRDPARIPNPYAHWLFKETDENDNVTTYVRDGRMRVREIHYQGGASESFTYDNLTNQVTSHTMPSGAVETKTYYPPGHIWQGLLWQESNSVEGFDARKEYTYDGLNRVYTMTDARARAAGKPFTVRMTYNGRHKVTKVEYASTAPPPTPTPAPTPSPTPQPEPTPMPGITPWVEPD